MWLSDNEMVQRVPIDADDDDDENASSSFGQVDPKKGLTWERARTEGERFGPNQVTPPVNCPQWLCCILPCLMYSHRVRRLNSSIPDSAFVLRESEWTDIDAISLVVSDVVKLQEGDVAPADMLVVECSDNFVVDTVCGQRTSRYGVLS